ncbi:uncharacterized protein FIBRA_03577 [Fibroporia radiculosa]|uniref:Pectate lyase superfamily protein domain-containing protein n=1 Tax=Fibroporia radiculosa TaxID=599839 RepID=J4I9P5_9APHY|nr:uncharacterized protein FIBRA_03577 [Fibroporia radiculosa]CCM01521.1 predicted protein [Fibroporia radiculosa]
MNLLALLSTAQFLYLLVSVAHAGTLTKNGDVCTVSPSDDGSDDTPAILSAFAECSQDATIVIDKGTFNIETVMETVGLQNVTVDLRGTLLWSTNITYWRGAGLPLNYLNMTSAWVFGGSDITFNGNGYGTFDGQGQVWYDFADGAGNVAGRPISLIIANTTNSRFTGIRFVQSQFWTMAITQSENLLLDHIYVNSTSNSSASTLNTDGVDTFFSNNITFRYWSVTNGDDSISQKANSSNILIQDCVFYNGNGIAVGSIGQYNDTYEFITNVTAERVVAINTVWAGYIKTWTGEVEGYPPNGGGGGIGYASNITFRDFAIANLTNGVTEITQCISYNGDTGGCGTSTFAISDYTFESVFGTISGGSLANLYCSNNAPCPGIDLDFANVVTNGTRNLTCSNVVNPDFECTGPAYYSPY